MGIPDFGLLLLRVIVGLTFAAHGAQKAFGWWRGAGWTGWNGAVAGMGFRPAGPWAAIAVGAELFGGLLLAAGFITPVAAMALVGQSVVIIGKAHWAKGYWNRDRGFEFPLALGTGAAAVGLIGPGAISLDAVFGIALAGEVRALLIVVGLIGGALSYATTLVSRPPPATG